MAGAAEAGAWQEWRRHWSVIIPCFLGIMLVTAHGYSMGVMILPLEEEFGWLRSQISAGLMIVALMALLAGPLVGGLVDRFGPRRIGLAGVLLYCSSLAGLSLATGNVLTWWGLWFVVALAGVSVMPVVWIAVLNAYFFKSRGLAMAIALSGTGMGAAVWPMLTNALVEGFGWRMAYVGLAGIGAVICFPAALILFREADGARRKSTVTTPKGGVSLAGDAPEARSQMRNPRFVKMAAAAVIFALANGTLTQNMVPVLVNDGLTPAKAAATAGLLGLGSITGRLVGGLLLDRYNANIVAAVSVILPIVTVALLLAMEGDQLWAAIACLVMGFAVGAELDCAAYLVGRHLGTLNFGALFGAINGMLIFGAAAAPVISNLVYDLVGSYDPVLVVLVPAFVVTAILFLALGEYRHLDPESGKPLQG